MTDKVDASQKFLDPRMLAKLQGLRLRARHIVEGYVAGLHRSHLHGFSIEFAEHREYAPGDDLRYLDWKAFGRTDKFYLKQYEDETNLICYIVIDSSESMRYRSSGAALSKWEYAQCVAAALAWLVLRQQDAIALVTFDKNVGTYVRPSTSPSQLRQVLEVLDGTVTARKTETGRVFHELAERFTKRGVVLVLSDLFDHVPSMMAGLKHFRHRCHDVIVYQILDPAEMEFPFQRPTLFKGLEDRPDVLADPQALRTAYLREFGRFLSDVKTGCRSQQLDYEIMRTDQTLDVALSRYLASRMAKTS